jgi:hypothetical protein
MRERNKLCIATKRYNIEGIALSRHKYWKRISPLVIQVKDFKSIKKENPTFFLELKQFGIVVYGK